MYDTLLPHAHNKQNISRYISQVSQMPSIRTNSTLCDISPGPFTYKPEL